MRLGRLLTVLAFGRFLNELGVEGLQIPWVAGGGQTIVDHNFFVHPVSTSVLQVNGDLVDTGDSPAFDDTCVDQQPWAVADGRSEERRVGQACAAPWWQA